MVRCGNSYADQEFIIHREVSVSLRSPREHENSWHSRNMLPSSIRHSRACGHPGLFCAKLAWIPRFRGYDGAPEALRYAILPSYAFFEGLG